MNRILIVNDEGKQWLALSDFCKKTRLCGTRFLYKKLVVLVKIFKPNPAFNFTNLNAVVPVLL